MNADRPIRCFIAVTFSLEVVEAVTRVIDHLRVAGDVRWVSPEQIHVTLKFLGSALPADLERAGEEAQKIANACSPFMVELEGLGVFPTLTRPRVVWLGVGAGAEQLCALARGVETACAAAGFAREKRGFHPHLTLGRVRSPRDAAALTARLRDETPERIGTADVTEFLLMESDLRPQGAVYTVRERFALKRQESPGAEGT